MNLHDTLGGQPRKVSENTTVWQSTEGFVNPMTILERKMYDLILRLTKDH